jgi:hypothetical protein
MDAPTLTGKIVRLEPLGLQHEPGLWQASRDPRTWLWMSIRQPQTEADLRAWLDEAIDGLDIAFATVVLGSRGNLPVPPAPHHRSASRTGD